MYLYNYIRTFSQTNVTPVVKIRDVFVFEDKMNVTAMFTANNVIIMRKKLSHDI